MSYYINYNTLTGAINTRYVTDINDALIASPPAGTSNKEVTDEDAELTMQDAGYTVINDVLIAPAPPSAPELLSEAQSIQLSVIEVAYSTAIYQPIAYMGTTFQADKASQSLMTQTIVGLQSVIAVGGTVPANFSWWDINNIAVPMTLLQLQGLYATGVGLVNTAFAHKQTQKAAIRAASTVTAVQEVIW